MKFVIAKNDPSPGELERLLEDAGYRIVSVEEDGDTTTHLELDATEDETERERALSDSEERLRLAITGGNLGTWHWNADTDELIWSERCAEIFGVRPGEPQNFASFIHAIHPEDRPRVMQSVERAMQDGEGVELDYRIVGPQGAVRWVSARGRMFAPRAGRPPRIEGVVLDITPQKQAELALLASERRFRELADALPYLIWQIDREGGLIYSNRANREYLGTDTIAATEWEHVFHPEELSYVLGQYAQSIATKQRVGPLLHRLRDRDGSYAWFVTHAVPVCDDKGELEYMIGTSADVSELKRVEQQLLDAQSRLVTALQAGGMGTWRLHPDGDRMEFDDALLALHGLSPEEGRCLSLSAAAQLVHEDYREAALRAVSDAVEHGSDFSMEVRALRKDGSSLWLRTRGRARRDQGGTVIIGASVEITQQKLLEEQLRQAQKMEAIGKLAGGVAHDFNNMLTIIAGRVSLLRHTARLSPELEESLRDIALASERAASLTTQLLAFARRQVLRTRDVDLNEVAGNVLRMLARTLGEQIECVFRPAEQPLIVDVDEGMITQVLLNLAVNARDAMPRGGELTITTRITSGKDAVTPRPRALLEVRDTGEGMSKAVLEHVFEPFFTTKPAGKGTGLGLATVYGIVTQHGGTVDVESAPGLGATFRITFPLGTTLPTERAPTQVAASRGRGETVLLVEDEASVLRLVQHMLEANGYRVIPAESAEAALAAFERHASEIDAVLTDMVLRGSMNGRELLERLNAQRPGLKMVLTSGYSVELASDPSGSLRGVPFLRKPFNADELLRAMNEALAGKNHRPRPQPR